VAGLSQEGATVMGTAVGLHFPASGLPLPHRPQLGRWRLADRRLDDGGRLGAAVPSGNHGPKSVDE
jgi:hypothetical protein